MKHTSQANVFEKWWTLSRAHLALRQSASLALVICMLPISFTLSAQQEDTGPALFSVEINSDSTDVKSRHFNVMRYQNGQCQKPRKGARLFRKKFGKESHRFDSTEIPSGSEFFFQIEYSEMRRQGDRACTVLSGFQPEANKSYKAVYDTSGQVSRCSVTVFDVTAEEFEITTINKPEMTCARGKVTRNKNSVPIHTVKPLF